MNSHIVNCLEPQPEPSRRPQPPTRRRQPARACLVGLGQRPVIHSWRCAAYGRNRASSLSDSSVRIRIGSGRDGGSARPGICGGVAPGQVRGLLDVPGPPQLSACSGGGGVAHRGSGVDGGPGLAERPVASPAAVCRVAGASSWLPEGAAVRVDEPGRKGNTIGVSVQSPVARLVGGAAPKKPGRGARRGASDQRSRATSSDIRRSKLLAEPHPATLRADKRIYMACRRSGVRIPLAPRFCS